MLGLVPPRTQVKEVVTSHLQVLGVHPQDICFFCASHTVTYGSF